MKFLLLAMATLAPVLSVATTPSEETGLNITTNKVSNSKYQDFHDRIKLSYGLQYLGPSFFSVHQEGGTYNRINGGQDYKKDDTDATSSTQIYQSISFGYKATKDVTISYGITFQNDLNGKIKYKVYNSDGSVFAENERKSGISQNNHRINTNITNIYSNSYFFLMSNFHYELPTTEGAKNSDMLYGLGIQPTVGVFSSVAGLFHGLKASVERDYYKRQEYTYSCGTATCTEKKQTLRATLGGYIGYNISDKLSVKADVDFDWDQDGDEVETSDFYKNMDDVITIGPKYQVNKNMSVGTALQYAISDSALEKSALIGSFSLSL